MANRHKSYDEVLAKKFKNLKYAQEYIIHILEKEKLPVEEALCETIKAMGLKEFSNKSGLSIQAVSDFVAKRQKWSVDKLSVCIKKVFRLQIKLSLEMPKPIKVVLDTLRFTAFFDETGSVTNDTAEIFGGSLFLIENSQIDECRSFLKEKYPKGIHCKDISKSRLLAISQEIGNFLKNKNCCAVTSIQTNPNFISECKKKLIGIHKGSLNGLLKLWFNYLSIPRFILFSIYSLSQKLAYKNITVEIFMENVIRNKKNDCWNIHAEDFKNSLKNYKKFIPHITSFLENHNIKYIGPKDKTKQEEIMFSFPDLFAYAGRRMVTHKEYDLYNNLKPIFNKFPFGSETHLNGFKNAPQGMILENISAEEFSRVFKLSSNQWNEELKQISKSMNYSN